MNERDATGREHDTDEDTDREAEIPAAPAGPQDPPADPAEPMNPA